MKTFTNSILTRGHKNREGKTHLIAKRTQYYDPIYDEYISVCGLRFNPLSVKVDKGLCNCKKCLRYVELRVQLV